MGIGVIKFEQNRVRQIASCKPGIKDLEVTHAHHAPFYPIFCFSFLVVFPDTKKFIFNKQLYVFLLVLLVFDSKICGGDMITPLIAFFNASFLLKYFINSCSFGIQ